MQKHHLSRPRRAQRAVGVTETGAGGGLDPQSFHGLAWFFHSFQNPLPLLTEKSFLSEFISEFLVLSFTSSLWGGGIR